MSRRVLESRRDQATRRASSCTIWASRSVSELRIHIQSVLVRSNPGSQRFKLFNSNRLNDALSMWIGFSRI